MCVCVCVCVCVERERERESYSEESVVHQILYIKYILKENLL